MDAVFTAQIISIAAGIVWVVQQLKQNTTVAKYSQYLPFVALGLGVGGGFLFNLGQGDIIQDILNGLYAGVAAIMGYKSGKLPDGTSVVPPQTEVPPSE